MHARWRFGMLAHPKPLRNEYTRFFTSCQDAKFPYICPMKLELFIARRVAASGQQSFSRVIIRLAVIAIALCVAVMILATALITGFKHQISDKIFGFWGHIHITSSDITGTMLEQTPISIKQEFYPELHLPKGIENLHRPSGKWKKTTQGGIRHIQVFALKPGIIKTKNELEGIILKGVGRDFDWSFMEHYLKEGERLTLPDSAASSDILISRQTANRLGLQTGDKLIVHFVQHGKQLRRAFRVKGIFKTGLEEYDKQFALVDIRKIQQLEGWAPDQVGGFEVFVENLSQLDAIANYIYSELLPPDLYAETIREKFPQIFEWLSLQDINEVVILTLMLIVGIINMITALLILILERTRMIGILKAMGSTDWSIRKIFLYYAGHIILWGLFWGNLVGLGLGLAQQRFGLVKLSEESYYLATAPIEFNLFSILGINLLTLLITLLFLIIPSYLVTRISPVQAIRFE